MEKQGLPSRGSATNLTLLFEKGCDRRVGSGPSGGRGKNSRIIMAVKIRMKRVGTKNTPVFRIVVADGRSPRDGKFIEEIGTYQPLQKGTNFTVDVARADYWISQGAQPSDTVASFLKKARRTAVAAA
jgi:small subunit ribosomal protein S16